MTEKNDDKKETDESGDRGETKKEKEKTPSPQVGTGGRPPKGGGGG